MKINSLSSFCPEKIGLALILRNSEQILTLPLGIDEAEFYHIDSHREIPFGINRVVVDLSSDLLAPLLPELLKDADSFIGYWCPRTRIDNLRSLSGISDEFAFQKSQADDDWLYLEIGRSTTASHESDDFFRGLELPLPMIEVCKESETNAQYSMGHHDETHVRAGSWRDELIQRVIPFAKPFKSFLPRRVIIFLYRIVNRFRNQ